MFEAANTELQSDKWQRLSPSAILHYIVKFVRMLLKQGLSGLAPIAAVVFTAGENRWFIIGMIAASIGVIMVIGAFLSYLKFRYRINKDTILIQSGVFTRKRLSLNFDRIQNVAIKEPLYFRPFQTVVLAIESAGSSEAEVALAGVPRPLAESIRFEILETKKTVRTETKQTTAEAEETHSQVIDENEPILTQPITELAKYGVTNNNVWVFAGIAAGAGSQFEWWNHVFIFDATHLFEDQTAASILLGLLSILAGITAIITALVGVSMIGAIIVYYGFTLYHFLDGRFHRTKGLFERQETSLPDKKVQSLTIKQPWPALLLTRFNLILNQVGFEGSSSDGSNKSAPKFIIPSVKEHFVTFISERLYPDFHWQQLKLGRISRRYTVKTILYNLVPIVILPTIALSYGLGLPWGLFPLIVPVLAYPIVARYRKRYGFASDGTHGLVQTGFIGTTRRVFPFFKVQTVELIRSPGQRKYGHATLRIKMAGSTITIPYMPIEDAEKWQRDILENIEATTKAWM